MIPFAIWLLSLAIADIVASFSGRPMHKPRFIAAIASAAALSAIQAAVLPMEGAATAVLVTITTVSATIWLSLRYGRAISNWRRVAALVFAFSSSIGMVLGAASWESGIRTMQIPRWWADSPFRVTELFDFSYAYLAFSMLIAQLATGNALVRMLLETTGKLPDDEETLKAGRVIGPIERMLIFGIGLAGEPAAAALVASAKSILRFPELASSDRTGPKGLNEFSEYVVLGSLASWLLAAIPLILLVRA